LILSTVFINGVSTSFFIILCCILSLLFYFITNKKIKYIGNTVRFLEFELIKIVKNAFNGIKTVIIFNKQSFFQNKFFKIISQKKTNEQLHEIISKLPKLFLEIVFTVAIVVFINFFIKTDIDLQSFLPFLIFLSLISIRMLPIFSNLNSTFVSIRYMEPVVKKMINVILTVNNNVKSIFINNKLSFRNINNIELI
jgi:ABC-type multidrug transport system fused ATPase/permease subunit